MEHRQGTRYRVGLPVAITVGSRNLGWHVSKDVGNGGIALYLNDDIDLPCNCVVELVIEVGSYNRVTTESAKAVVVHKYSGAIGLMWISHGISLQKLLPETLRQAAA